MPRTKPQTSRRPAANGKRVKKEYPEVLTLDEAAAYLRVTPEDVLRLIEAKRLPGQQIGTEWRMLKTALQEWLKTPAPAAKKEGIWAWAGAFRDDPHLDEIVREAYRRRGRPITEEG